MHCVTRRAVMGFIAFGIAPASSGRMAYAIPAASNAVVNSMLNASANAEAYFQDQLKRDKQLPQEQRTVQRYIACAATTLEHYAAELEKIAPSLPPKLQALPTIVSNASRSLRLTQTVKEASAVLRTAVEEVRRTIELVRADDPDSRSARVEAASVTRTLNYLNIELVRTVGI